MLSGSRRGSPEQESQRADLNAPDLRLVPLAALAWLGAFIGTSEQGVWTGVGVSVLAVLAIVALVRHRWVYLAATVVGLSCVGSALIQMQIIRASPPAKLANEHAVVAMQARVASDPVTVPPAGVLPGYTSVRLDMTLLSARGSQWRMKVPVDVRGSGAASQSVSQLKVGTRVSLDAVLSPAQPGRRVAAQANLRGEIMQACPPSGLDTGLNRVRSGLREAMRASPTEQAGLVPSLVVGDTSRLSAQIVADFKATALTHLTAVSGTNLTLMLVFFVSMAKFMGVRGWWLRGLSVVVVVGFVLVCRAEPSVLRAAAMGVVALAATGVSTDSRRGIRQLCVAMLILLLLDPWLGRNWGFALSVLATGGILWWAGPWQKKMAAWAPVWLAESVCIPLAAQLATQPVVTALSGSISVVGLAANALAGPFVGPITVLGFATALTSLLSPTVAVGLGWVAGWFAQPLLLIAHTGARVPAATWAWPRTVAGLGVLGLVCLWLGWVMPWLLTRRWAITLMLATLLAAGMWQPPAPGWPGPWQVVACDVGQGDATAIKAGPASVILVDTGPDPEPVLHCLSSIGVRSIPLLVLTHFHGDHVGGLDAVLGRYPVGLALTSPLESPALLADHVLRVLDQCGIKHHSSWAGEQLQVGSATWLTIGAGAASGSGTASEGENAAENDAGIVGVASASDVRVMMTGDIEIAGQQATLASGFDLHVDVFKVPHHGSSRQEPRLWAATGASVALVSVGLKNTYGHPTATALGLASRSGMAVFRTDLQSALAVGRVSGHIKLVSLRPSRGP